MKMGMRAKLLLPVIVSVLILSIGITPVLATPQLSFNIGGLFPKAVTSDSNGRIIELENSDLVNVYDSTGAFQFSFFSGVPGSGNGITVDSNDRIIVVGSSGGSVFNSAGVFQFAFGGLVNAHGVTTDSNDRIIVADLGASGGLVKVFNSAGVFQFQFFHTLVGDVATDSTDRIIAGQALTGGTVSVYDSTGAFQFSFTSGSDVRGVAVDSTDRIIAVDQGTDTLRVFNSAGALLSSVGGLNNPEDVGTDNSDRILVADTGVGAVRVYDPDKDGDGFIDSLDNCPAISNVGQADIDGDGVGDVCDPFDSSQVCGTGTLGDNGLLQCVPDLDAICGDGTMISGLQCIGLAMMAVGGTLLEIDTFALFVGAIGVNPVITGLVVITIAGVVGQVAWFVHRKKRSR